MTAAAVADVPQESWVELRRRLADQKWRLHNLYTIQTKDEGRVRFTPNWAQLELLENLWFRNNILKARQLGMSTFINLLGLDQALFMPDFTVGIVAHKRDAAKELFIRNVKFPYDNLPPQLYEQFRGRETTDSKQSLSWDHGSSIRVDTSFRSGTPQMVHISEFGKICARRPDHAREIVTGTIEALPKNGLLFIESTAEGNAGYFYDYCRRDRATADEGRPLTSLDRRFHFFPWHEQAEYRLPPDEAKHVRVTQDDHAYFERKEAQHGITIDPEQRAWYVQKRDNLVDESRSDALADAGSGDMRREYPTDPDEAFEAAVEGAYFAQQMAVVRKNNQITQVAHDPSRPVATFWDIGIDDYTAIWFYQFVNGQHRFIHYLEDFNEGADYYAKVLLDLARERGYVYEDHYLPHDGTSRAWAANGKAPADVLEELGIFPCTIVESPAHSISEQIQSARSVLPTCFFDAVNCKAGIQRLDNFRKEWDERLQVFREKYLHDLASHGATAFMKFSYGYSPRRPDAHRRRKSRRNWRQT